MKTLLEVGTFVGIPQNSGEFNPQKPISLGYVRHLLSVSSLSNTISSTQPFSMQEAIEQLQSLPQITLDARLVGSSLGEGIFAPVIRIGSSPGLIISTRIHYASGGETLEKDVDAAGGDIGGVALGPGAWKVTVRRAGIGTTGYKKLEKAFDIRVRGRSEPNPEPNPEPIPGEQTAPPIIKVDFSGSIENASFHVTGSEFLKNRPATNYGVLIRVVDAKALIETRREYTGSSKDGRIDHVIRGDLRGLTLNALGIATIAISATDGRPNSADSTGFLWSNTVRIDFRG